MVESHLGRHPHIRRGSQQAEPGVHSMQALFLCRETAGLTDLYIHGITKAERALGKLAPGQELACGSKGAIVVIAENDGDDRLILQLGDDDRGEVVDEGIVMLGIGRLGWYVFPHEYRGPVAHRVREKGFE